MQALLSAVALAATAAVLAQATVDWSWYFGGLIAPPIALLGSAAAPAAQAGAGTTLPRGLRAAVVTAAAVLALVAVPTFLSERQTLEAARKWRADPAAAVATLNTAADLNPFAVTPLLVESEIDRQTAITRAPQGQPTQP